MGPTPGQPGRASLRRAFFQTGDQHEFAVFSADDFAALLAPLPVGEDGQLYVMGYVIVLERVGASVGEVFVVGGSLIRIAGIPLAAAGK